jgi:hypothetical protein
MAQEIAEKLDEAARTVTRYMDRVNTSFGESDFRENLKIQSQLLKVLESVQAARDSNSKLARDLGLGVD